MSWIPPEVTQRAEHAPTLPPPGLLAPSGTYSRFTEWKWPRGGLLALRRAGWKTGADGATGSAIAPGRAMGTPVA